jgi:hypothetical protein
MKEWTKLKRDYWSAKMRVACEPLAMRPITKHRPEARRPCHSNRPPCRPSIVFPASLQPGRLVGRSQREEREDWNNIWNISTAYFTSPRDLPTEPFLPSCAAHLPSYYMHLLLLLLLHYRMHLHIITTSPRKGPTRPAAHARSTS